MTEPTPLSNSPQPSPPKAVSPKEEPEILAVHRRAGGWTASRRELLAGAAGAVGVAVTSGCDSAKPVGPAPTAPRRFGIPIPGVPGGVPVNISCADRSAHSATITLMGGSPDGRYLASVDDTGVIKIWGAEPPAQIRKLDMVANGAKCLAFDARSIRLVVAADKSELFVCNLETGTSSVVKLPEGVAIHTVLWVKLPDDSEPGLLVLLNDGRLWQCHRDRNESLIELWKMVPDIAAIAVSPDAETLVIARKSGEIELRRLATPLEPMEIAFYPGGQVRALAFSHQGDLLAIGGDDGAVRICGVADRTLLQILRNGSVPVTQLAFDSNGGILAVAHADKSCRTWPVKRTLLDPGSILMALAARACAWSRSGTLLMLDLDGQLSTWTEGQADASHKSLGRREGLIQLAAGDESAPWLSAAHDGTLWRWTSEVGGLPQKCGMIPAEASTIACDTVSHTMFVGSTGRTLTALRLPGGQGVTELGDIGAGSRALAVSPVGSRVAGVNSAGVLQSWTWPERQLETDWIDTPAQVVNLAFSPDGRFLAACGADRRVVIWACSTRHVVSAWKLAEAGVEALCFDSEGHLLLIGEPQAVTIWNVQEGRCAAKLETPDRVTSLAVSPSGRTLIGVTDKGVVRSWTHRPVQPEKTWTWATTGIQVTALSPAGDALFIASGKSAAIWKFATDSAGCLIDFDINYDDVHGYEYDAEFAGVTVKYRVAYAANATDAEKNLKHAIAGKMARPLPPPRPNPNPVGTSGNGGSGTYTYTYTTHYWRPN